LLGAGLLRPADLNTLLADLIDPEEHERAKPAERWQKDLILAAEIGADRDWNLLRTRPTIKVDRLQGKLRTGLIELLNDRTQPLPIAERVRAGFQLGDLSDPRFPVTFDDWRREIARAEQGDTSGYFCRVEPGTYIIGSADDDPDADDTEKPQHTVVFDAPFWIARYPITNAQLQEWSRTAQLPPRRQESDANFNRPNQPAAGVNWHLASTFCAWLSQQTNTTVRLPSEAEWEAAAYGRDGRRYPWGNEYLRDRAAIKEDEALRTWPYTVPVGCYPAGASAVGALDMAGNIWEWTSDVWWVDTESGHSGGNGQKRVLRGGGYSSTRKQALATARIGLGPGVSFDNGFRIVLDLED
jgi:formylglycine-generating enzyme required for sulfatase activity